jgi:hypothetical protein
MFEDEVKYIRLLVDYFGYKMGDVAKVEQKHGEGSFKVRVPYRKSQSSHFPNVTISLGDSAEACEEEDYKRKLKAVFARGNKFRVAVALPGCRDLGEMVIITKGYNGSTFKYESPKHGTSESAHFESFYFDSGTTATVTSSSAHTTIAEDSARVSKKKKIIRATPFKTPDTQVEFINIKYGQIYRFRDSVTSDGGKVSTYVGRAKHHRPEPSKIYTSSYCSYYTDMEDKMLALIPEGDFMESIYNAYECTDKQKMEFIALEDRNAMIEGLVAESDSKEEHNPDGTPVKAGYAPAVGDLMEILSNTSHHNFNEGDIVEVKELRHSGNYDCVLHTAIKPGLNTSATWTVNRDDAKYFGKVLEEIVPEVFKKGDILEIIGCTSGHAFVGGDHVKVERVGSASNTCSLHKCVVGTGLTEAKTYQVMPEDAKLHIRPSDTVELVFEKGQLLQIVARKGTHHFRVGDIVKVEAIGGHPTAPYSCSLYKGAVLKSVLNTGGERFAVGEFEVALYHDQSIKPQVYSQYKAGDTLQVTSRNSGHNFKLGSLIEVITDTKTPGITFCKQKGPAVGWGHSDKSWSMLDSEVMYYHVVTLKDIDMADYQKAILDEGSGVKDAVDFTKVQVGKINLLNTEGMSGVGGTVSDITIKGDVLRTDGRTDLNWADVDPDCAPKKKIIISDELKMPDDW